MSSAQSLIDRCYVLGDANACRQSRITREPSGPVSSFFSGNLNLPDGVETEGYDFRVRYRLGSSFGNFEWDWNTTYTSYFGELGEPDRSECPGGSAVIQQRSYCVGGAAQGNVIGTYEAFDPRWRVRSNLVTKWSYGDWGATVGVRYYSALDENCSGPASVGYADLCSDPTAVDSNGDGFADILAENRIGSRTYVDLQATWDAPWNGRIALGVNNAFDRDPPIAYSAAQNSFDPQYPIPGRFWYIQYSQKF